MMPRFSSSTWCARWSARRLAISGDRTGRVTTRYISLPRNFSVDGSTLLGLSAMGELLFLRLICVSDPRSALGDARLRSDVLPACDFELHALGRLLGRAAPGKAAELAQLFVNAGVGDGALELTAQPVDDRPGRALGGGRADP